MKNIVEVAEYNICFSIVPRKEEKKLQSTTPKMDHRGLKTPLLKCSHETPTLGPPLPAAEAYLEMTKIVQDLQIIK